MSNEEEKRCPLCAEEMDWTDQQFKPCQCGYQVCVWCWHHIMDMAEKDETEGRCPACRTIYEKEKIVAMQANCERMAANNSNRKNKPPKVKPKASEVKKDLTNVRVIQRKMAYVIGLPLVLADEDILQRKEYFGQYGKVAKISLSRTAGGAIQQYVNDTCSVYITYSKEEEALRCIQSVHGFVLDGRFLRASFGTAKYCHAWLRNMPCNNPSCLYLHSFGVDEDSFGKDEVAAVHTRNRVQQMAGASNNILRRSGSILPPPVDDFASSTGVSSDNAILRNSLAARSLDSSHGVISSNGQISNMLQSKSDDGGAGASNKMTTFVDVVGRPNSSGLEKDGNTVEDRRILNLHLDLPSGTLDNQDFHAQNPYSDSILSKVSSSNHLMSRLSGEESKDIADDPFRDNFRLFNVQGLNSSNDMSQRAFLHPSYHSNTPEGFAGWFPSHKRSQSAIDCSLDHNTVHIQEDEAPLPIACLKSALDDKCHEAKFKNSAKSDRIYRGSNSFSNEEIVEHLRRIDDDSFVNDEEISAFDVVESSIISNIMSMDFDSGDDSLKLPPNLSDIFKDNGCPKSSWNSQNNDRPGFPFVKQDEYASQMIDYESSFCNGGHKSSKCSILQDSEESKEHYLYKSQIQASKPQSVAPPGFSIPSRDPPPGFSAFDRTGRFSRVSSGSYLMNSSPLPNPLLQNSLTNNGTIADVDFIDPAISSCRMSNITNGISSSGLEVKHTWPRLNAFKDKGRPWSQMQQSNSEHEVSKFNHTLVPQAPSTNQQLRYPGQNGDGLCTLGEIYGISSRLTEKRQIYEPSSLAAVSQQKYANGHISNGYQCISDDVHSRSEVMGVADLQRNERLGFDKYFPGYGDLRFTMPGSGDVYTRVFGM